MSKNEQEKMEAKEFYIQDNRKSCSAQISGNVVKTKKKESLHRSDGYFWIEFTLDTGYKIKLLAKEVKNERQKQSS